MRKLASTFVILTASGLLACASRVPPTPIIDQAQSPAAETTAAVSQEGSPTVAEQEAVKVAVDSSTSGAVARDGQEDRRGVSVATKSADAQTAVRHDVETADELRATARSPFVDATTMLADSISVSGIHRQPSVALTAAAQDHADFMARYRATLDYSHHPPRWGNPASSHDTNGGSKARVQRHGWQGSSQEILAMRPKDWKANCWEIWRGSPAHWQAVMSSTTHCGFGVATGEDGCTYYVGLFGNSTKEAAPFEAATGVVNARILPQSCLNGQCFRPLQPAQGRYVPQYVPRRGWFGRR